MERSISSATVVYSSYRILKMLSPTKSSPFHLGNQSHVTNHIPPMSRDHLPYTTSCRSTWLGFRDWFDVLSCITKNYFVPIVLLALFQAQAKETQEETLV